MVKSPKDEPWVEFGQALHGEGLDDQRRMSPFVGTGRDGLVGWEEGLAG